MIPFHSCQHVPFLQTGLLAPVTVECICHEGICHSQVPLMSQSWQDTRLVLIMRKRQQLREKGGPHQSYAYITCWIQMDAKPLLNFPPCTVGSKKVPYPSTCNDQTKTTLYCSAFSAFCKSFHIVGLRWTHVMLQWYVILHKYFNKTKADTNRNSGSHWQAPATHQKEIKHEISMHLKCLGRYANVKEATIRAIAKSQAAGWKNRVCNLVIMQWFSSCCKAC